MTFKPSPLKLVPTAPKIVTRKCENPPDPIDAVADWKRRLAAHEAIKARRLQRIDWYLTQRAARS
jgi:hypothetical protein